MTPQQFRRVEELFKGACAQPAAVRDQWLREQCSVDIAVLRKVEGMLAQDERGGAALDAPAMGEGFHLLATGIIEERLRAEFEEAGRFRILSLLGEGGFGSVYCAEQLEPVQRNVAIKVIKLGMDTRRVLARFEAERQMLASMSHPGIAKCLDAGTTPSGRPYFVMELIEGVRITKYCDQERLDTRNRLQLFAEVCEAVRHAHQKEILHRDIKPSNVLVTRSDGKPQPVIIDFGVSRAMGADFDVVTQATEAGQMVGTLEYVSPEQAEGSRDIDTRTDIYSLGILLYELLTGTTPIDRASQSGSSLAELQRIIREYEPPPPSVRVRTSAEGMGRQLSDIQQPTAGSRRPTAPGDSVALSKVLRGELDWIVMKAIEKDRARRYETVDAFLDDVLRHLRDESVHAVPPSRAYRMRKFIRRNRVPVAGAAMIALVLIAGIIGTSIFAVRAEIAKAEAAQRADQLEQVAEFQASQLADIETALMGINIRRNIIEQRRAALEARQLDEEEVARMLAVLDSSLAGVNFTNVALEALDENILGRALDAIESQFADQPLTRARLFQTVAATMHTLGLLERATKPQTEAVAIRRRLLGDDHPDTLKSINNMGVLLAALGKHAEAESLYREAWETRRRVFGSEHPDTLASITNLGSLLLAQGRRAEAEAYHGEALAGYRRVLGDDHPDTLNSINSIGVLLVAQGRFVEAEAYHSEALAGFRRVLGDEHPSTLNSINNMAYLLAAQRRFAEAEPYYREALEGFRRVLGDEHPSMLNAINNMGGLLQAQGKPAEAEPYFRETLQARRRVQGNDHRETLIAIVNMGAVSYTQGRYEEAVPYWREALEGFRRVLGDEHPQTLGAINNMGSLLRDLGRLEEAERFGAEAVEGAKRVLPAGHTHTSVFLLQYGRTLAALQRFEDAESALLEAHVIFESSFGPAHDRTTSAIRHLTDLYENWHEAAPGNGYDAKAAEWRAKLHALLEPDHAAPQEAQPPAQDEAVV